MKSFKNFLFVVLTFVSMTATSHDFVCDGIYYTITSAALKTVGVSNNSNDFSINNHNYYYSGSVVIPETVKYNGTTYSVTSIEWRAFYNCIDLNSVVFPEALKKIGVEAFYNCENLNGVKFPSELRFIGGSAFGNCIRIDEINLPSRLDSIGVRAFYGCTGINEFTFPIGIKFIGDYAFGLCSNLKEITFPDGMKLEQKERAEPFWGCSLINTINFPKTGVDEFFQSLPRGFFRMMFYDSNIRTDLRNMVIPEGVTRIPKSLFEYNCNLETLTLPSTLTVIEDSAFMQCFRLKNIIGGENVEKLGSCSFAMTKLGGYPFTGKVKKIPEGCFARNEEKGKEKPVDIILPEGLEEIEGSAFSATFGGGTYGDLDFIDSIHVNIHLPNSIQKIGLDVFNECIIHNVSVPDRFKDDVDFMSSLYMGTNMKHHFKYVFPEGTTEVPDYFSRPYGKPDRTGVVEVVIPEGVVRIGKWAFEGCTELKTLKLPSTIREIDDGAFYGCTGLTTLELPSAIRRIGYSAFAESGIQTIEIPEGVTKLEYCTFAESALQSIKLPSTLTTIEEGAFTECNSLKSIEIPSSVTKMGQKVFCNCKSLESVVFNEGLKELPVKTFYNCDKLDRCKLPDGLEVIGDYCFQNCTALNRSYSWYREGEEFYVPSSVRSIGWRAFENCDNINIGRCLTPNIEELEFSTFERKNAFSSNSSPVTIPKNLRRISNEVFRGCNIRELVFEGSIDFIGVCFEGTIPKLVMPKSITEYITTQSFVLKEAKEIYLPDDVRNINDFAVLPIKGMAAALVGAPQTFAFYSQTKTPQELNPKGIIRTGIDENNPKDLELLKGANSKVKEWITSRKAHDIFKLYVPVGTKAVYESTKGWSDAFDEIIEREDDMMGRYYVDIVLKDWDGKDSTLCRLDVAYGDSIKVPKIDVPEGYALVWDDFREKLDFQPEDIILYCYFKKLRPVTLTVEPVNAGSVGINKEDVWKSGTTRKIAEGTELSLWAKPAEGAVFEGWYLADGTLLSSETSTKYTVTGQTSLVAKFQWEKRNVTVVCIPSNGGTVTGAGSLDYNSEATLVAHPAKGFSFGGWFEKMQLVSSDSIYRFKVTDNKVITAMFTEGESPMVDMSSLIVNANFSNGDAIGWVGSPRVGGEVANANAEVYNANFDVYQIIKVPNGRYRLMAQAFYRTGRNALAASYYKQKDEDEYYAERAQVLAFLYANENEVAVKNIMSEAIAYEYYSFEKPYRYDKDENGIEYYVPNGQANASQAFSMGMYDNYVDVIVRDSTLRLGIRSTATENDRWTCFDNFRLYQLEEGDVSDPSIKKLEDLENLDFEADEPITVGICTYSKDMSANNTSFYSTVPVHGWTSPKASDGNAAGTFAYGSGVWLGGRDYKVPSMGPDNKSKGQALGLLACWTSSVLYTQTLELEPGDYRIRVKIYNSMTSADAGSFAKNLIGFIEENGTEHYSKKSSYDVGKWTEDIVRFTLTKRTIGNLSLGYVANDISSSSSPHLFIDNVCLEFDVEEPPVTYTVTTSVSPKDGGVVTGGGTYNEGQIVTLTAKAAGKYEFIGWMQDGKLISYDNPYVFTVKDNSSIVAMFEEMQVTYTISATASPSDGGTVTGAGTYVEGEIVTIAAVAATGYHFTKWKEDGYVISTFDNLTFEVTENRNLVAIFEKDDPVTITVKNITVEYGEPIPELEYTTTGSPLRGSNPTLSCDAVQGSPVGTYTITVDASGVKNSEVKINNGKLTIKRAQLIVGVEDVTIHQGDPIPELTITYDGFKMDDTPETALSELPTAKTTAKKDSPVGTYIIYTTGGAADNYTLKRKDGTLTVIEPRDIVTITAKNVSVEYGEPIPELEYTTSGSALRGGKPLLNCDAVQGSPVGTYSITVDASGVENSEVNVNNGKLTIKRAPLTVGVEDVTIYYGDPIPELVITYEGLKMDETPETAFSVLPTAKTTAREGSSVGTYIIYTTGGTAPNYSLKRTDGTLTIEYADGVDGISENQNSERWCTLDGRVLSRKPIHPGIYLRNGVKVVIR